MLGRSAPGPSGAVTVALQVDDPRIDPEDLLVANAEPFRDARAEVVDDHVGIGEELQHGLPAGGGLQIDADTAFACVDPGRTDACGQPAIGVTADLLHLDDVGPHVGEE